MHSLLSVLFGLALAALVYGFSLLPSASLADPEETGEQACQSDNESETIVLNAETLSLRAQARPRDAG